MKWLKIVLLTVLLISCRNAEKAQDHQAFIAAKDLYLQGDSQGALEKLEALEKHKPSYFPSFILDGRISLLCYCGTDIVGCGVGNFSNGRHNGILPFALREGRERK